MSSGKLISEIKAGDLVLLRDRRKKNNKRPAVILKVLSDHDRIFVESTIWDDFHYMVYTQGKTIYVTEGHIERVISSHEEPEI